MRWIVLHVDRTNSVVNLGNVLRRPLFAMERLTVSQLMMKLIAVKMRKTSNVPAIEFASRLLWCVMGGKIALVSFLFCRFLKYKYISILYIVFIGVFAFSLPLI